MPSMTRALWSRFTSHLYVRIWLGVVATIVVLTFAVGTAWQLTRPLPQLPIREVIVENAAGEVIGTAQTRPGRKRGEELEFEVVTKGGETLIFRCPAPSASRAQTRRGYARPSASAGCLPSSGWRSRWALTRSSAA